MPRRTQARKVARGWRRGAGRGSRRRNGHRGGCSSGKRSPSQKNGQEAKPGNRGESSQVRVGLLRPCWGFRVFTLKAAVNHFKFNGGQATRSDKSFQTVPGLGKNKGAGAEWGRVGWRGGSMFKTQSAGPGEERGRRESGRPWRGPHVQEVLTALFCRLESEGRCRVWS